MLWICSRVYLPNVLTRFLTLRSPWRLTPVSFLAATSRKNGSELQVLEQCKFTIPVIPGPPCAASTTRVYPGQSTKLSVVYDTGTDPRNRFLWIGGCVMLIPCRTIVCMVCHIPNHDGASVALFKLSFLIQIPVQWHCITVKMLRCHILALAVRTRPLENNDNIIDFIIDQINDKFIIDFQNYHWFSY